ncbi:MAG: hypothetical protein K0R34_2928 [Herbinix sp.]|jgi:hypothetical protein|nr:hypothetical protein [Herbinix sp.]
MDILTKYRALLAIFERSFFMNMEGLIIGAGTFAIIGILHPVVIKTEYYFGTKVWPVFFISGIVCVVLAMLINNLLITSLLSVLGFSLLWSIRELYEQKTRVEKGWFPKNPRRR